MKKFFLTISLAVCFFAAIFFGACATQPSEKGKYEPGSSVGEWGEESDCDSSNVSEPASENNDVDLPEVDF